MPPPAVILGVYGLFSIITYLAFFVDKLSAINRRPRTPEKILHSLSFAFGVPGAILAILTLRHKNRKPSFWLITALIAALHLGVWLFFATR